MILQVTTVLFLFVIFSYLKLSPIPENPRLEWTAMRNGVSKCSLKYDTHTVELIKSEKEGDGSSITIHIKSKYCFNWTFELIRQYNLANHYAKQAAIQFRFKISEYGYPSKRPHVAFEQDLIAYFIAASHTAEIKSKEGEGENDYRSWIDSSNGAGELETNEYDYSYDYLMMPKTVREIADTIIAIRKQTTEYERHYHPRLTINN